MFSFTPLIRFPKESEMAISNQVKESVELAASHLRQALAFAARTEHPVTISSITDILCRLESLEQMDEFMEKFTKPKDIPSSLF
jgi:hypothetical protein